MYSFGGRGGKVYVVNSLADSGPGTLREACEAAGPRIVVFSVAGIIHLKMPILLRRPTSRSPVRQHRATESALPTKELSITPTMLLSATCVCGAASPISSIGMACITAIR